MTRSRLRDGVLLATVVMLLVSGTLPVTGAAPPRHAQEGTTNLTGNTTTLSATTATTTGDTRPTVTGEPTLTSARTANNTPDVTASAGNAPATRQPVNTSGAEHRNIEPNDKWENATGSRPGQTILETLTDADRDWFIYQLQPGKQVNVSLTASPKTNMSAFLYRGGDLVDRSYVYPDHSVTLTAPLDGGGKYYVLIRDESGANTPASRYAFNLHTIPNTSANTTGAQAAQDTGGSGGGHGGIPWFLILLVVLVGGLVIYQSGMVELNWKGWSNENRSDTDSE